EPADLPVRNGHGDQYDHFRAVAPRARPPGAPARSDRRPGRENGGARTGPTPAGRRPHRSPPQARGPTETGPAGRPTTTPIPRSERLAGLTARADQAGPGAAARRLPTGPLAAAP